MKSRAFACLLASVSFAPGGFACAQAVYASPDAPSSTGAPSALQTNSLQPLPVAVEAAPQLDEVIVQARRVDESQQRVPLAISTVTADRLQTAVVSSVDDVQRLVPSLQISQSTTGQLDFTIRGSFAGFGVDPSVISYIDDVAQDPRTIVYGLFDLNSVQELKGPQGTLFGRNSTGGAVLFQSNRPKLDSSAGYLDARFGSLDERRVEGAFNVPVSATFALRLAGEIERRDGTFDSVTQPGLSYDDRDNQAVRGSLLWRPTARVEDYLQATYYRVQEHRSPFVPVSLAGPCTGPVTPAAACLYQPPFNGFLGTDNLRAYVDQQAGLPFDKTVNSDPVADEQRRDSVTNTLTVDLGSVTVRNTSYYGDVGLYISRDYDGTPAHVVDAYENDKIKTFYSETQVYGRTLSGLLDWRVGFVYSDDDGQSLGYQNVFPLPGSLVTPRLTNSRTDFESKALFAQGSYDLSALLRGLSFTAGYRYTWDDRSIRTTAVSGAAQVCALQTLPVPAAGPVAFPNTDLATCQRRLRAEYSDDNYNLTLQWVPVQRVLLYATTRKGYKTGSFNVLAVNPALAQYAPEVVHDAEIGAKIDWKIGGVPLRTNVAAFRSWYDNVQTSLTLVDPVSGSVTAVTLNQDPVSGASNKATIQGFELEGTARLARGLQISAFYSYIEASYDRFFTVAASRSERSGCGGRRSANGGRDRPMDRAVEGPLRHPECDGQLLSSSGAP